MNSGRENGAAGLSVRTDVIHTSRSGAVKGSARNSTALTTENTAMFAPIASASVDMTANAKPGRRRNWRIATERSFHSKSISDHLLDSVDAHAVVVIDRAAALFPPHGLNITSDLVQVRKVVTGQHSQHHGQRLRAALIVLAGALQIRR